MKIGEARQYYIKQRNLLYEQKRALDQKLKDEQQSMTTEERGVILELSNHVTNAYERTGNYLADLAAITAGLQNTQITKQQGDGMSESTKDMAKCLEIARRISHGDKVPAKDEQKLMEYSLELYLSSKNAAAMNKMKSHKEYESLWEDEDGPTDFAHTNQNETVEDMESPIAEPDIDL